MISADDILAMSEDTKPYFKHMGDVILNDGFDFPEAEEFIWNEMDEAATLGDWERFHELMHDYDQLEENYA